MMGRASEISTEEKPVLLRARRWAESVVWFGFFALILIGWWALYLNSPALNGAATFGSLDSMFAWAAHEPPSWPNVFYMWSLMSLAMMMPTIVPMVSTLLDLTHARVGQVFSVAGFLAGYAVVWVGFALIASILQVGLYYTGLLDALGLSLTPTLTLFLLILAGGYQFSSLKQACLRSCQAPMMFFVSNWRDGFWGGIFMGMAHGFVCLGCCWALMTLGFVGGAMNLIWMGLATLLMALEKLPSIGTYLSPMIGCVLLALSLAYGLHIFFS